MPIVLTKDDKINLVKISFLYIIFEIILIGISFPIYNQFKDIQYIIILFGMITPIFLYSSISYLLFKYRIYIKLYAIIFIVTLFISILTGLFLIQILQNLLIGSFAWFLSMILLLISYGIFSWMTEKITLFLANKYIKMVSPTLELLEKNTLIFRIDEKNKDNKINSLLILLKEVFSFHQIKDIDNRLLMVNNNTGTYILIYKHQNTLVITPFKNSIYEFDFEVSDIRQSINDLVISLLNFEKIDARRDEESRSAFANYIIGFKDYCVKKSEIKELFPFARIIAIAVIVIIAIISLFIFYPRIPEFFQYLQNIGATAIIIGTIIGGIILAIAGYSLKFLQKRFFKK